MTADERHEKFASTWSPAEGATDFDQRDGREGEDGGSR